MMLGSTKGGDRRKQNEPVCCEDGPHESGSPPPRRRLTVHLLPQKVLTERLLSGEHPAGRWGAQIHPSGRRLAIEAFIKSHTTESASPPHCGAEVRAMKTQNETQRRQAEKASQRRGCLG